jgi:hypothetical protein
LEDVERIVEAATLSLLSLLLEAVLNGMQVK